MLQADIRPQVRNDAFEATATTWKPLLATVPFLLAIGASRLILKSAPAPFFWLWLFWAVILFAGLFGVARPWCKVALVNLSFIALFLAVLEGYFVEHEYTPPTFPEGNLYVPDNVLGWVPRKGATVESTWDFGYAATAMNGSSWSTFFLAGEQSTVLCGDDNGWICYTMDHLGKILAAGTISGTGHGRYFLPIPSSKERSHVLWSVVETFSISRCPVVLPGTVYW